MKINKFYYYSQILIIILAFSLLNFPSKIQCQEHHEEEDGHHHSEDHNGEEEEHSEHHSEDEHDDDLLSTSEKWAYGLVSTLILGVIGFFCSALVICAKLRNQTQCENLLKVLIAFAAGALIGDAFIHLIPKGFGAHEHESHEEENSEPEEKPNEQMLSLMLCLGLLCFFIFEKLLSFCGISHDHGINDGNKQQSKINEEVKQKQFDLQGSNQELIEKKKFSLQELNENNKNLENDQNVVQTDGMVNYISVRRMSSPKQVQPIKFPLQKQTSSNQLQISTPVTVQQPSSNIDLVSPLPDQKEQQTQIKNKLQQLKGKKSEGYINLIGDFFHNILDGIAMGAIFASGDSKQALSTFIAILAHEIPQEIGDIGILLNSNFSNLQALLCNGLVNFSAMIGCIIGLGLGEYGENTDKYLTLFIAGNFLYLGACDMIPLINKEKNGKIFILQCIAMLLGFGAMYLVLLFEGHEDHSGEEDQHQHNQQH